VHPSGETCFLVDAASKNGTLVNGRILMPYQKCQLTDRDEISIGPQTKMVYFSSTAFHKFLKEMKTAYSL
jgi:pSer/pThr/pTyr-binding forkhead associated (FHA) protein